MKDDQLLPEQGLLRDELGSAAEQVGGRRKRDGRVRGLRDLENGLFENRDQVLERLDKWKEQEHTA